MKIYSKTMHFSHLFQKNKDGSLSPKEPVSILGTVGDFKTTDKIIDLKLVDGTHIHDHAKEKVEVRKLGTTFMIMSFC
jgi:hypothetical protein